MLALVLLAGIAAPAPELALVLVAPAGEMSVASRSEIYRVIDETLRASTELVLTTVENTEEIAECQGALGCIVLRAGGRARFLVFMSLKRVKGEGDRMTTVLLDVGAVLQEQERARTREELENAVFERAVKKQVGPIELQSPAEVSRELERLFRVEFRPLFESTGHLKKIVPVSAPPPGERASNDGLLWAGIGTVSAGAVATILGVALKDGGDRRSFCAGAELDQARCAAPGLAKVPGTEVSLVSIGWSVALTGLVFGTGALIDGEHLERPLWWVIAGVLAGGALFTASTLADSH